MSQPEGPPAPASSNHLLTRVLPAATFLVGLLLGWVLVVVTQGGDEQASPADGSSAGPTDGASPTATASSGDLVITVPAACRQAGSNLREMASLLRDSVGSVRDFDPDRLVEIIDRLETLDRETRPLVDECSVQSTTTSPSPSSSSPTS